LLKIVKVLDKFDSKTRLVEWLKWESTCLAKAEPFAGQTPAPPKKK
jgi:hypothetical protein